MTTPEERRGKEVDRVISIRFWSEISEKDTLVMLYLDGYLVLLEDAVQLFLRLQSDQDTLGRGNATTKSGRPAKVNEE